MTESDTKPSRIKLEKRQTYRVAIVDALSAIAASANSALGKDFPELHETNIRKLLAKAGALPSSVIPTYEVEASPLSTNEELWFYITAEDQKHRIRVIAARIFDNNLLVAKRDTEDRGLFLYLESPNYDYKRILRDILVNDSSRLNQARLDTNGAIERAVVQTLVIRNLGKIIPNPTDQSS